MSELNDALESIKKIKELLKDTKSSQSAGADDETQMKVLRIAIEEQRRVCDWIAHNYDNVRSKILTSLGGALASLTFLYASGGLFLPSETYGRIFYFAALFAVMGAIGLLIMALRPMPWEFTIEDRDLNKIHLVPSELEYLKYVKEKHMEAYKMNIKSYEFKQRLFNLSLHPLVFGVIILVVIKLFS